MEKQQVSYAAKEKTSSKAEDTSLEAKENIIRLSTKKYQREIKIRLEDCVKIRHFEVVTEKLGNRKSKVFDEKDHCEDIPKTLISCEKEMITHYIERTKPSNLELHKNRTDSLDLEVKGVETDELLTTDQKIDISEHKRSPVKSEVLLNLVKTVKTESFEEDWESEKTQIINTDKTDDDNSSVGSLIVDCDDNSFDETKDLSLSEAEDNSLDNCTTAVTLINNLTNKNDDKGKTGNSDTSVTPVFKCGLCSNFSLDIQVIAAHKCKPNNQVHDSTVNLKQLLENMKRTTRIKLIFTFGCELCGRMFLKRRNYMRHVRKMHKTGATNESQASVHTNKARTVRKNCKTILSHGGQIGSVNYYTDSNICASKTELLNAFGSESGVGNAAAAFTRPRHTISTNLTLCRSFREGSDCLAGAIKVSINGEEMYKCSSCNKLLCSVRNYWRHVLSRKCIRNRERKKAQASCKSRKRNFAQKGKSITSTDLDTTSSSSKVAIDNMNFGAFLESSLNPPGVECRSNEANVTSLSKVGGNKRNHNTCIAIDNDEVLEECGAASRTDGEQEQGTWNISLSIVAVQGNYEYHEQSVTPPEETSDIIEPGTDSYSPFVHLESDNKDCTEDDDLEMDCSETVYDKANSFTGNFRSKKMYKLHTVMIDADEAESAKCMSKLEDVDPLATSYEVKNEMSSSEIKGNNCPQEVTSESEMAEIVRDKIPIAVDNTVSLQCRAVNTQATQVVNLPYNSLNENFLQSNTELKFVTAPDNITNTHPIFRTVIQNEPSSPNLVVQGKPKMEQTATSDTRYKIIPTVQSQKASPPTSPLYICQKCKFATFNDYIFLSHVCATTEIQQNKIKLVAYVMAGRKLFKCLKCGVISLHNDEESYFASHICHPDFPRKEIPSNSESTEVAATSKKRNTSTKDTSSDSAEIAALNAHSVTHPIKKNSSVLNNTGVITATNTNTVPPNNLGSDISSHTKNSKMTTLPLKMGATSSKAVTSHLNGVKSHGRTIWKCLRCKYVTCDTHQFTLHSCSKRLTGLVKIAPKVSKLTVQRQANAQCLIAVKKEGVEPAI